MARFFFQVADSHELRDDAGMVSHLTRAQPLPASLPTGANSKPRGRD